MGLIIGPRGNTQKRMQAETNTRIAVRGKGAQGVPGVATLVLQAADVGWRCFFCIAQQWWCAAPAWAREQLGLAAACMPAAVGIKCQHHAALHCTAVHCTRFNSSLLTLSCAPPAGSVKEGAARDPKHDYGEDEEMHVLITGDRQEDVDAAAAMIERLLQVGGACHVVLCRWRVWMQQRS